MKKLALLLCGLLVLGGCTQTSPSETPQPSPTPAPTLVQTITDPAFLEQFWEDYIDDVSFTIVNGYSSFDSIEDINDNNLVSFLYLKMQRAGETDVMVGDATYEKGTDLFLREDKLTEYCQKFFNTTIDFSAVDNRGGLMDGVYLQNVYTLDRLPDVRYNQIEEFPNSELLNVEEYSDGTFVANLREHTVAAVDETTDFLLRKITLRKRDDGSYYFVSSSYDFTPTNHVTVEGNSQTLPYHENYSYGSVYAVGEKELLGVFLKNGEVHLTLYDVATAAKLRGQKLPYQDYSSISELKKGENLLLRVDNVFYKLPLDLSQEPQILSLPLQKEEFVDDVTPDLTLAALTTEEGILLVDLAEGGKKLLPETATYYEVPDSIMSVHGFGGARFVNGGKKLLYTEGGYEGFHGFWLYDLETEQRTELPYSGGYPSTITTLDNGMYLTGVFDKKHNECAVFIDFATGETTLLPDRQEEEDYWQAGLPNGDYSLAVRTKIGPKRPYETTELFIRNAKTGETLSADCKIVAPAGSVFPLAVTAQGKGYVLVSHMAERFLLEVKAQ